MDCFFIIVFVLLLLSLMSSAAFIVMVDKAKNERQNARAVLMFNISLWVALASAFIMMLVAFIC